MKSTLRRSLEVAVVSAAMCAQPIVAHAGIVSTEQVTAQDQAEADRAAVQGFLDRANVKERMQALGVDGVFARDRVAALSDHEVHQLAARIDGMPAGGNLSQNDLIIVLLVAILVAIAL
jgi:hypothetical protein